MAKIAEHLIAVRLSKLTRNDTDTSFELPDDFAATVEAFIAELLSDPAVIVEVATDEE